MILVFLAFGIPIEAHALDCAFEDTNDNQVFDGADVLIPDAAWLGGVPFNTANGFVLPTGCNKILVGGVPGVVGGVVVTAAKITLNGRIDYLAPGGRGVVFLASGDLAVGDGVNPARVKAGGFNALPLTTIGLARKSVALGAGGKCDFKFAEIAGTVPQGSTGVGIVCTGDLTFTGSQVIGSRVNIQSLAGKIDASNTGGGGGGGLLLSLAALCDAQGNNNGILDGPDFPCSVSLPATATFADEAELQAACATQFSAPPPNFFAAFNDPMIMIAGAGSGANVLDVRFANIVGRYRVVLGAEDASILSQNAVIDHGEQLGLTPPGGARTWLFADPTAVIRLPVDHEDFTGPSAGSTFIQDACYRSGNPIRVGQDGALALNLIGTSAPAPCAQLGDFVGVQNGNF